jgi:hypothetical protein
VNVQDKTPDTTNPVGRSHEVNQVSADSDGAYLLGLGTPFGLRRFHAPHAVFESCQASEGAALGDEGAEERILAFQSDRVEVTDNGPV